MDVVKRNILKYKSEEEYKICVLVHEKEMIK